MKNDRYFIRFCQKNKFIDLEFPNFALNSDTLKLTKNIIIRIAFFSKKEGKKEKEKQNPLIA
jgi:hypothetical protein